jgi:protein O-GlcNAc transferase
MFSSLKKRLFGVAAPVSAAPALPTAPAPEEDAATLKRRGNALLAEGDLVQATQCYRQAVALAPNDVAALVNLGFVLGEQKHYAEARRHLEKAIRLDPTEADAFFVLGAVESYTGNLDKTIRAWNAALAIRPQFTTCRLQLSQTLLERGRLDAAAQVCAEGLAIQPESFDLQYHRGNLHHDAGEYEHASESFRRALALQPDHAEVLSNWGRSAMELGDYEESLALTRSALRAKPGLESATTNLLFLLNYHPDLAPTEIFAAYREYDQAFNLPLRSHWVDHLNSRDVARRLKVGYVSPDFRQHVVSCFLEPMLAHYDKQGFEVFAFAELANEDAATARFRSYVDHWVTTVGMSDDALAERISADKVDILVDLAGHTASNRLRVFARKPAPVSLSWLGFGYTTGLSAIDYLLTDEACAPAGSEALFSEHPWRLDTPGCAYRPPAGAMGDVSALPALNRGYVTFGTLTRAVRINHHTVRVWARVLRLVPTARLVIDSNSFKDPGSKARLQARFAAHGIDPERLQIGYHSPPWDVLREIDITLDCFPHNSGTTLFESLYMGLPFVTLAGRPSVGRLGSSILTGVGHPEWIAHTEDEYVDKCVALASDLPALAALRAGLRDQMRASPLMDEVGFARKVEAAYREMFKRWAGSHNDQ